MTTERMGVIAVLRAYDRQHGEPVDFGEAIDAVAELARAAKVYFDGYCADEADDHFDPGEPRGEETGCTREQHRAAKDLRAALAPFQTGGAK